MERKVSLNGIFNLNRVEKQLPDWIISRDFSTLSKDPNWKNYLYFLNIPFLSVLRFHLEKTTIIFLKYTA